MQNVKIIKAKLGYFLTIGELEETHGIENTWAVTALELITLEKMLGDIHSKLLEEISKT